MYPYLHTEKSPLIVAVGRGLTVFVITFDSTAPDQSVWPEGTAAALREVLNAHIGVFGPLDYGQPLNLPPERVETSSGQAYNRSFANLFERFSPSQYESFMGTVHTLVASGHFSWIDHRGYRLSVLPGGAGPSRDRAPVAPGTPPPQAPWIHSAVLAPKGEGGARVAIDFRPLNELTLPRSQQAMPSCDDVLTRSAGALVYSCVDAANFHY